MRAEQATTTNAAPLESAWLEQGQSSGTYKRPTVQSQLRVSVVDDEPTIGAVVGELLEENGFNVTVFTDPHRALMSARRQPPHIVVTDFNMPFMSGIELCDRLRKDGVVCGMVLFSGALSTVLPEQLAMLPGIALLDKPSNPGQLVSEVFRVATSTEARVQGRSSAEKPMLEKD
jgi:CheY-like chemotaxis protein